MAAGGAPVAGSPGWDPPPPTPIDPRRASPYHPIQAYLQRRESSFSFALVRLDAQGSPGSRAYTSMCGVDNLYDDDGAATCPLALLLRGILPGVTSMRQITIHAEALNICLVITASEASALAPAEMIRLELPATCDPAAVRAKWTKNTRQLSLLLPLMPIQDSRAVRRLQTVNSALTAQLATTSPESTPSGGTRSQPTLMPTRLFAGPPCDATTEGLRALHRSPSGSTVTCAADGNQAGGNTTTEHTAPVDSIRALNGSMVGTTCGTCSSCSTPQVPADQTALCGATSATGDAGLALAETPGLLVGPDDPVRPTCYSRSVIPAGAAGPPLALAPSVLAGATSSFGDTRPDHAPDDAGV